MCREVVGAMFGMALVAIAVLFGWDRYLRRMEKQFRRI